MHFTRQFDCNHFNYVQDSFSQEFSWFNIFDEDSLFILVGFSDSPFKLVILVLPLLGDDSVFIVFTIELTFNFRCEHEKLKSADACLMEVIGEKNPEHFFVATQDVDLRKKLQEVRIVFVIFCCS